jgi:hypothetical protein
MALVKLDAETTLKTSNKARKWQTGIGNKFECLRPVVRPNFNPSFRIDEDDVIFAMGSCFAREIEIACPEWLNLMGAGANANAGDSHSQNKYNVCSILNQIKWAFGLDDIEKSYSGILPGGPQLFKDFQGHNLVAEVFREIGGFFGGIGTREECTDNRTLVNKQFLQMTDCNVFIITLGLAEVWLDKKTGLFLNITPSTYAIRAYPGRFEFHQLEFNEILSHLEEIYSILSTNINGSLKILLTVSPIPYQSTFTPSGGAIEGNCYSKSVQRAAVESFRSLHDNVGYFPSYEMALHTDNQYVWEPDFIHVKKEFSEYIVAHALNSILSEDLLAKHDDISREYVDHKMTELFSDQEQKGVLSNFLNNIFETHRHEDNVSLENERLHAENARLKDENGQKFKIIKFVTDEKERLLEKYNELLSEKLRKEIAESQF